MTIEVGKIPDDKSLKSVQELCLIDQPYQSYEKSDHLFLQAMKENILWHMKNSPFYQNLVTLDGFNIENLNSIEDLALIPFITADFFKSHEVKSIKDQDIYLHLTSSGTTGQKSQIFFDQWSITCAQKMVENIFKFYGWVDEGPSNYLLYSYQPEFNPKLGTAFTDNYLCQFSPINQLQYALKSDGLGQHEFDLNGCIKALFDYQKQALPVRIFGFPAFLYFTIEKIKKIGTPLKLHPKSLIFLGGGWKGHADKAIDKKEFYQDLITWLGVDSSRIKDGFGSVEHCIPYIECENHHFHIPIWSRVLIRDLKTLQVLDYDQPGFLNFISPYITSTPANNVLMGDYAVLHSKESCQCKLKTPWFEIIGRAGISKNKSCAIAALDLMKAKS